MPKELRCPICSVLITPDVDGKPTTKHDPEAHERRRQEDWGADQVKRDDLPKPGLYNPPGDPALPPYVRALIEKRPDLKESILLEYEQGLAGQRLPARLEDQPVLPLAPPDLELRPPRRSAFGYDD